MLVQLLPRAGVPRMLRHAPVQRLVRAAVAPAG
jgi:hypothetical protein